MKETFQVADPLDHENLPKRGWRDKGVLHENGGELCGRKQGTEILWQKNHSSVGWEILPLKSHMLWNVQGEIVSVGS